MQVVFHPVVHFPQQQLLVFQGLAQGLAGPAAVGDVLAYAQEIFRFPGLVAHQIDGEGAAKGQPVRPDHGRFPGKSRRAAGQGRRHALPQRLLVFAVGQSVQGKAEQFRPAAPGQPAQSVVDPKPGPIRRGMAHAHRRLLEGRPEKPLVFDQRLGHLVKGLFEHGKFGKRGRSSGFVDAFGQAGREPGQRLLHTLPQLLAQKPGRQHERPGHEHEQQSRGIQRRGHQFPDRHGEQHLPITGFRLPGRAQPQPPALGVDHPVPPGLGRQKKRRVADIGLLGHQPRFRVDDEVAVGVAGHDPGVGHPGHVRQLLGQPAQVEFAGQDGPPGAAHPDIDAKPAVHGRGQRPRQHEPLASQPVELEREIRPGLAGRSGLGHHARRVDPE